jgi:hypothetical protein
MRVVGLANNLNAKVVFIVVSVIHRGRGKTDCDFMDLFCRKSMKLSISLQFKIEKLLGGQPMLIFA